MIVACLVGLFLGFFGSVPVAGPASILVLKNALERGHREGFDIAVGAAVGEAIYAFVAFWGLTSALVRFPFFALVARVLGAVLLIGIGVYLVIAKRGREPTEAALGDAQGRRFVSGFVSAIFNPTLIVTWTSVVTAIHATELVEMRPSRALPFALGVGFGIMGWFAFLVKMVERFRVRMRRQSLDRVVRAMGWAMIAIGMFIASRTLWHMRFT
jgi:threonine/homoserine/homoserine lactone efflux protein